ncbi:phosphate ABC transporter substrate-binding protein [Vibrio cidicii]|uniref:Phosphate-binding protein n=1 Tax=Vibrio cidicii TaxID=1763883 RepID=A0A151JCR0_9VIBR|nr:phosphate ABC transporter substrate-binding protein [Vibrio cidicii]EJN6826672.1 phosphate ABC transporter substrate-binding protein [Vibrio cidicii]KYN23518.1 phosphate ABC transporter substrate-binding protein [Vibrio cidicii]KYN85194.1 phosphate ABC transporter substrate-binding protein [Vibrio cidicii]MBG0753952.1 phosphate ABC transporter substrate-binding protein [Vibrio cidicii]
MIRLAVSTFLAFALSFPSAYAKELNISGSTSVARVMDVLAEEFNKTHTETFVAVQGIGSSAGITMVNKGVVKLGMSSRYLTEMEKGEDLNVDLIAYDGLALVVNISNPINNLTQQQIFDIYQGKLTNWKQVGGEDKRIAAVTREASSGSRYSFESLLGLTKIIKDRLVSDISTSNLVVNSNSMVKTIVNHNPQAIGFVSLGSVDRSVKAITIDGIDANAKNIATNRYLLSRPFLILYKSDNLDQSEKEFIRFIKSERGQAIIQEYGYIPAKERD